MKTEDSNFPIFDWALYAGISSSEGAEGIPPATQVEEILAQAAGLGLSSVPKVAFIEHWTGADLYRPELAELRRKVQEGEVSVVVAYSPDVFAVKPVHQLALAIALQLAGAQLHFVHEASDYMSRDTLIPHLLENVAHLERSPVADRMKRGKERVAQSRHLPDGAALFGYDFDPQSKRRFLKEVEAAAVRLVFQRAAEDWTPACLAKWLNGEGYRTKRGRLWTPTGVKRILANRAYTGVQIYGVKRNRDGSPGPAQEVIPIEGFSPPIISSQRFELVQARGKERQTTVTKPQVRFLLTGLAQCFHCDAMIIGCSHRGKYLFYRCSKSVPTSTRPATCEAR